MALIHLTNEAFDKATASGLAMVDFWATWCGPCKMLSPVIDGLADRYEGKVLVGKVNTDEQPELAIRFGVMSIPTVIFLKDGKEIDRKVGVQYFFLLRNPQHGILAAMMHNRPLRRVKDTRFYIRHAPAALRHLS